METTSSGKIGFFHTLAFKIAVQVLLIGGLMVGIVAGVSIVDARSALEGVYINYLKDMAAFIPVPRC